MTRHRTSRARPLRALAALAAALGIVAATSLAAAAPASAVDGPHCKHDRGHNACLSYDDGGTRNVDVGIDVVMGEQYGREVLACGPDFRASLWGDDGARGPSSSDDLIRNLDIRPGWPMSISTGISAALTAPNVHPSELDEDQGVDQIYARVSFYDCNQDEDRDYVTGYLQVVKY